MSADDQPRLLQEATKKVREQSFFMNRAMDNEDLKLALDHATEMLRELRTGALSPRNYYELYMKVVDELRGLEEYFHTIATQGNKPVVELYEQVQSCGNVLPRLYLLITVGSVYIKTKEAPARDILKDLIEMIKGVQHPMRGLFLRNYLSHVTRDKLPDIGSEYEGDGGSVQDAIEFVLTNFAETNRLWVRMQNQGSSKERKKRERERQDLRILVGTNLVRLSQLEGVDVDLYREQVLPKILRQVESCKDTIAQGYLMDCIIQVFPDDFHLATLEPFLTTISSLKERVNVRTILEAMMDRLANYVGENNASIPDNVNAFQMLNDCVTKLLETRRSFAIIEVLRIQTALLNFALKCYPDRIQYVNHCLGMAAQVMSTLGEDTELDEEGVEQIERLLSIPLETLALGVLSLSQYGDLLTFLPWTNHKQVSLTLARSILKNNATISDVEMVEKLFRMMQPLLRDQPRDADSGDGDATAAATSAEEGGEGADGEVSREFQREQSLVARVVHLMDDEDTDNLFRMYVVARRYFGMGGVKRIRFTLVPLVFAALRLARTVRAREADEEAELQFSTRKVFQFVHEVLTAMATSFPEVSLKLFLEGAMAADQFGFQPIAYEFASKALFVYEDELADSRAQLRALQSIIGALTCTRNFDENDYDALITRTTQYAAKLLKKPDQCRMVTLCSHLFWVGKEGDETGYRNARRVLECLQRSLKIADVCMTSSSNVSLFVEILNQYLYYFENDNPLIADKYLTGLIALINEHIDSMESGEARLVVEAHYRNTLAHIRRKQESPESAEKFGPIVLA